MLFLTLHRAFAPHPAMSPESPTRPLKSRPRHSPWPARLLKLGVFAVIAIAVLVVGAIVSLRRYLHSDAFRTFADEQASHALNAEATFGPLEWRDTTALTPQFVARARPGAAFSRVQADGIEARIDLGAIWDKVWRIPRFSVESLTVEMIDGAPLAPPLAASDAPASPEPEAAGKPGFFASLAPNRLQIDEIAVDRANLAYSRAGLRWRADGVALRLQPGEDRTVALLGHAGTLRFADSPRKFQLDQLAGRVSPGAIHLTEVLAHSEDGAMQLNLAGEVSRKLDLRLGFRNVGAADVLADDWKKRLTGQIEGELNFTGDASKAETLVADGRIELKNGRLEFLPVLEKIASHTKNDSFRRIPISIAKAKIHRTHEKLEIRQFSMESPGLLRIDGVCDVVNGNLDGIFQVGIAPGTLRWVPGAESKVFSRREDGFLWATMRLVGPLDSPSEDLSDRLYDAAVAATIEEAPKKVIETGAQALDAGKNAAGALLDTGSKVIEKGAEAIRGFVPFFK